MARYTFGDDDVALRRLALVAEAYEPTSRGFLERWAPSRVARALDLGCGPGFSTALIARVCRPHEVVGLDSSPEFLASARRRLPDAHFQEHDITEMPLPGAPAEMLHARLVLAHLPEPAALVERWRQQLTPGGVLLLEELEEIEAPPGPLREYEEVAASTVREGGGVMYAGRDLAALGGRCIRVTVSTELAAAVYRCNVELWLHRCPRHVSEERLVELDRALARSADGPEQRPVSWVVRQIRLRA